MLPCSWSSWREEEEEEKQRRISLIAHSDERVQTHFFCCSLSCAWCEDAPLKGVFRGAPGRGSEDMMPLIGPWVAW